MIHPIVSCEQIVNFIKRKSHRNDFKLDSLKQNTMADSKNPKKLIINADDFGYTPGVTYGIIESYKNGLVSSTTALTVSEHFFPAMQAAQKLCPTLPIGLHLTLTLNAGKPILPKNTVPSLVDSEGVFWKLGVFDQKVSQEISPDEVYAEWEAQLLKFLESDQKPSHIDSHHYVHTKNEALLKMALKLAKKYDLPLRGISPNEENKHLVKQYTEANVKTTDEMLIQFYEKGATFDNLKNMIEYICESPNQSFEINVHTGFLDALLPKVSGYTHGRINELDILTSAKAKELIEGSNVTLTNFREM